MTTTRVQLERILHKLQDERHVPSRIFREKMAEVVDIIENRVYDTFYATEITMNEEFKNA